MLPVNKGAAPKKKEVGVGVYKNPSQATNNPLAGVTNRAPRPAPAPKPRPAVSSPKPSPSRAAAVSRRAAAPAPAPKPPPVVVPTKTGRVTKPAPPPPVKPGKVATKPPAKAGKVLTSTGQQNTGVMGPGPAAPATPAPPPPPDINTWLGTDAEYQAALNEWNRSLADYQGEIEKSKTDTKTSFAQRLRDLQTAQTNDEADLQEQMAGRGTLQSGIYADNLAKLRQQYTTSGSQLSQEEADALAGFDTQLGDFTNQGTGTLEEARLAAIARRAAQYGL